MPKIAAPTVAQHRAMVQRRLIDAAEDIMRSGEPEKLTAGAVTAAAGIARNSIYRYVDSVDDLRGMVLARHLPAWIAAVGAQLDAVDEPAERIVVWVKANLEQAARTGHGWLMGLGRAVTPSAATAQVMEGAHTVMRDAIAQAWGQLLTDPMEMRVAAGMTRGLLEAGFRQLDGGMPAEVVIRVGERAARGLVAEFARA